jgi:hypothetical protein
MATDDRSIELESVTVLFVVISTIAVVLRSYVRAILLKSFGADDWLAVATMVQSLHPNLLGAVFAY